MHLTMVCRAVSIDVHITKLACSILRNEVMYTNLHEREVNIYCFPKTSYSDILNYCVAGELTSYQKGFSFTEGKKIRVLHEGSATSYGQEKVVASLTRYAFG